MRQNGFANIYQKEQTEYIQNQRDKIRDSVEDRQSRIAWQMINEGSGKMIPAKAKLKSTSQQEWVHLWKQHFENLLGNAQKVTHEPITRCSWCNGYRRRKWRRWHEFKTWTRLIAFHIALIPLGKVWIKLFSLQLWGNSGTDWILQPWWGN